MSGLSGIELAVLGALVFFAGVVDALAGGGGLITLPAYLAMGLDPALLLGTNKLASSIGTVASTARYSRELRLDLRPLLPVIASSLVGAFVGARLTLLLDPEWLRWLLLVAVPLVGWGVYSRRGFGTRDESASLAASELSARATAVAFPVGAYDGFFGPGTGTFFALALTRFCRYDLLQATARAKVLNLVSNVAALAAFLAAGRVSLGLGLAMGVVSVGGHTVGSHLGVRRGAGAVRPAIVLVCGILFLKLLRDAAVDVLK